MTIRMLQQWNGMSPDSIQSLGSTEENRLVSLGYATFDLDGSNDGTESLLKLKIDPATGGSALVRPDGTYFMLVLTAAKYAEIVTKDANTLYVVVG